jgi:hypothetical protein
VAYPLRVSTASQEIPLGPFLSDTDGKTAQTGLTIANTDIRITKCGGTTHTDKYSGGATHDSNGVYYTSLDANDTNTLGGLVVNVVVAGALPVRLECEVLSAAAYDFLYGATALPVDVSSWKGATAPAMTGDAFARLGAPSGASTAADIGVLLARILGTLDTGTHKPQTGDSFAVVKSGGTGDNTLILKALRNKTVESSDGTTVTLYDDDGSTVLGTWAWTEATKTRGRLT